MEKKFLLGLIVMVLCFDPLSESTPSGNTLFGIASWYSESDPGIHLTTANGEIFDDSKNTCASWDFPFGTYLSVTSLANGKTVACRVNDRGPAKRLGRLIDLTKSAFQQIAPLGKGLVRVEVEIIESPYNIRFPQEALPLKQEMPGVKSSPEFSSPRTSQVS